MKTFLEYPLELELESTILMPVDAEILGVGKCDNVLDILEPLLWVRVETANPAHHRKIYMAFSGVEQPEDTIYIGTIQHGTLTYHFLDGGYAEY